MTTGPSTYPGAAVRATGEPGTGSERLPFVLAVDVEPDARPVPGGGLPVDGFARMHDWLARLRPRLEDSTRRPVRYAWYVRMDPQIVAIAGSPDALAASVRDRLSEIDACGDRIGLHTHAGRWDAASGRWIADHGDARWIERCLETSFAAFGQFFGRPCLEHRFGDRWSSRAAFDWLAARGVEVDLTVEPGQRAARRVDLTADATGSIPCYLHLRSEPIRHRDTRLWLLPLSAADPAPTLRPHVRLARRLRYIGQSRHRPLLLDRPWPNADAYWDLVEATVGRQRLPYLACAIRSDTILDPRWEGVAAILEALPRRSIGRRVAVTDGHGALDMLGVGTIG